MASKARRTSIRNRNPRAFEIEAHVDSKARRTGIRKRTKREFASEMHERSKSRRTWIRKTHGHSKRIARAFEIEAHCDSRKRGAHAFRGETHRYPRARRIIGTHAKPIDSTAIKLCERYAVL